MTENAKTPAEYGLNHDTWRPHQREMIEWAYGIAANNESKVGLLQAVTGTGKTTMPRALSKQYKTVALVRTKVLQQENYDNGYEFAPLYGRANYPCIHEDANFGRMANDCIYAEQGMGKCPHAQKALSLVYPDFELNNEYRRLDACDYVRLREQAKKSKRTVLNYAYWLSAGNGWPAPQVLVCDEGHQLSDQVLEWAGCTITESVRQEWKLQPFPFIRGGDGGILTQTESSVNRAIMWLEQSHKALLKIYKELEPKTIHNDKARAQANRVITLGQKISATLAALKDEPNNWYIKSGPGVQNGKPALVTMPLTAKDHFERYYRKGNWKLFIMSATIGDPAVFTEELGIAANEYDYHSVPSIYEAKRRPVLALDVPSMGRGATDKEINKQADQIAAAIKTCPSDWSGLIHVSAIAQASLLADRLARRGLQDRVWVAETGQPTNVMIQRWHERRQQTPGSLNISWAFHEGYDGRDEKISIVAKCAFPSLADEYEVARRNFNAKLYLQRTAWSTEQSCGRTRRGRDEDYDTDGERRGLVAIADGSWRMIKSYFSESFRDSIVKA